eukprot:1157910-Pelagomonas_calceolata.AAC.3
MEFQGLRLRNTHSRLRQGAAPNRHFGTTCLFDGLHDCPGPVDLFDQIWLGVLQVIEVSSTTGRRTGCVWPEISPRDAV